MMPHTMRRAFAATLTACALAGSATLPAQVTEAPAEFRAAWIATVFGLDFPSGNYTPDSGRARLLALIDAAEAAGMNAIIFQVRGECDAMYPSSIEPWNRWLTGNSSSAQAAPSRAWDPLQFVIDESRRRGIEVHAWFNPYRAGVSRTAPFASNHPSVARTDITVAYDSGGTEYWWLDPGNPDTRAYSLSVIMDVVSRYDIDAVHFDDYFYPYGINNVSNPFPDSDTYDDYVTGGGTMSLADWRRDAVNTFIQEVQDAIANAPGKSHIRFGISPFGIWQPGNPSGITGLNAYTTLYADSRRWLEEGWVDYMAPQLYWKRAADGGNAGQDFDALLGWWSNSTQNPLGRHVWPGVSPSWMTPASQDYSATDILNQVSATQAEPGATGNLFFRTAPFLENSGAGRLNITTLLGSGLYATAAVAPATTWLDNVAPADPQVGWTGTPGVGPISVQWAPGGTDYPQWYLVYYSSDNQSTWDHLVMPDWARTTTLPGTGSSTPTHIAVQAVDRVGNRSAAIVRDVSTFSFPIPGGLTTTFVDNFESTTPGNLRMFVTGSGSNSGVTGQSSLATALETNNRVDPRVASPGSVASRNLFDWSGASGGFYRLTTFNGAGTPNPAIDLTQGFGFYYKLLDGELDVRLFVRETGGSGPIGSNGPTTGPIERTSARRLVASPNWQYVWFDLPNESWSSFSGGNGVLDGTWGVFEALGIYQVVGATTSYEIYFDDFNQGQPHTPLGEPNAPRNPGATTGGSGEVNLAWAGNWEQDLRAYRVYRSASPGVTVDGVSYIAEATAASFGDSELTGGDTYYYRVTAIDHFGNESLATAEFSAVAGSATDTTAPTSSASIAASVTNNPSITVNFTASDDDSGVASTELFVRVPASGTFTATGLTQPGTAGSFNYAAIAGDGTYEFHTIATDNATNVEATKTGAEASILLDTVAPTASASTGDVTQVGSPMTGTYNANDGGSGLDTVTLYVNGPGTGGWSSAGTITGGTWSYASATAGYYAFAAVATDLAGNSSTVPTGSDPGDVTIIFNPTPNAPLTFPVPGNGTVIFPMTSPLDVAITFANVTTPGTLTVQRLLGDLAPANYNAARLLDHAFVLTPGGGLVFDTATLELPYDLSVVDAGLAEADVDRAIRDDGVSVVEFPASVDTVGKIVTVPGVTGFSTWYLGNQDSDVTDWSLLD